MKIIVQKFGGTSVKDEASRIEAKKHIVFAVEKGYKVIVVVSAIGRKGAPYATDSLLGLIGSEESHLSKREIDALISVGETISASVFTELLLVSDIKARFMTGAEAGMITNNDFGNAKVKKIITEKILKAFETNDVVVVTGFQGVTEEGSVTTLGRGGSDTSASLLGVAFHADFIDIFTDVRGIMTADPRLVEGAEFIEAITYQEVANLANNGAKVIHPRAVEIAMQGNIPLRIRSTSEATSSKGTLVTGNGLRIEHYRLVTGVTYVEGLTQFTIEAVQENQVKVLKVLKDLNISIDFINITLEMLIFNLNHKDAIHAKQKFDEQKINYRTRENCAKVSVVGAGITGVPGVVYQISECLRMSKVNILQAADSHTTIWILISQEDLQVAVNSLHNRFVKKLQ